MPQGSYKLERAWTRKKQVCEKWSLTLISKHVERELSKWIARTRVFQNKHQNRNTHQLLLCFVSIIKGTGKHIEPFISSLTPIAYSK
jgi:hypothetical protein